MARMKPKASIDPGVIGTKIGKLITPAQIAASGTEHGEQAALFQWIALKGRNYHVRGMELLFAVPNGGERSQSVAASLKAEGVRKGVPDCVLPVPVGFDSRVGIGRYHGLYLELKRRGLEGRALGARAPEQRDWHVNLIAQGYAVATAYGWQSASWVLKLYLDGSLVMPEGGDCFFAPGCDQEADW